MLSAEELKRAKNHLQKLWRALKNVDNNETSGVSLRSASVNSVPDDESAITTHAEGTQSRNVVTDELEEVLKSKEASRRNSSRRRPVEQTLEPIIAPFLKETRLGKTKNVLTYWKITGLGTRFVRVVSNSTVYPCHAS